MLKMKREENRRKLYERSEGRLPEELYKNQTLNAAIQECTVTARRYTQLLDPAKPIAKSPLIGLSYRYAKAKKSDYSQRNISRVMPTYGIYDQIDTMKSTRRAMDDSREEIDLELQNHDKLFFKQKFFMKTFLDEMIKNNVNPNKRNV